MIRADLRRLERSAPMIFIIWVILTLLSWGPSTIVAARLTPGPDPDPSGALFIETLMGAGTGIGDAAMALAAGLALWWVLSPLLSVSWLTSLHRRRRLWEALATGVRRYLPAVVATLALSPLFVLSLALGGAGVAAADAALREAAEPTHDLALCAASVPGLLALAVWATWHDLARARVAVGSEGGVGAVLGAWGLLGPRAVARYVGFFVLSIGVLWTGVWATGSVAGGSALVLGQMLVWLRLGVRGLYLAGLVAPMAQRG